MSLTLIQEQVLASLVEVVGSDARRRDRGVHPAAVCERLTVRRKRPVSETYVRLILRELVDQHDDGHKLVQERIASRQRRQFVPLNAAYAYFERRNLALNTAPAPAPWSTRDRDPRSTIALLDVLAGASAGAGMLDEALPGELEPWRTDGR